LFIIVQNKTPILVKKKEYHFSAALFCSIHLKKLFIF